MGLLRRIRDVLNRQLRDAQPARHRGDVQAPEASAAHRPQHCKVRRVEDTGLIYRGRVRAGVDPATVDWVEWRPNYWR